MNALSQRSCIVAEVGLGASHYVSALWCGRVNACGGLLELLEGQLKRGLHGSDAQQTRPESFMQVWVSTRCLYECFKKCIELLASCSDPAQSRSLLLILHWSYLRMPLCGVIHGGGTGSKPLVNWRTPRGIPDGSMLATLETVGALGMQLLSSTMAWNGTCLQNPPHGNQHFQILQ